MTVIATIITSRFTAHATDSFLTRTYSDGRRERIEEQKTKIVKVQKWRGAMSYWGLALHDGWSTLDWLRERADQAHQYASAEAFAEDVAQGLTTEVSKRSFQNARDRGIGIHFTTYENVDGYWVPELFQITNWENPGYQAVRPSLAVTRETFGTIRGTPLREENDRLSERRHMVRDVLATGAMFIYNNGDPVLFNPIANAVLGSFQELMRRGALRDPMDVKTHLALVQKPIETVSQLQSQLMKDGMQLVGGKPHALAIDPSGSFVSSTGD